MWRMIVSRTNYTSAREAVSDSIKYRVPTIPAFRLQDEQEVQDPSRLCCGTLEWTSSGKGRSGGTRAREGGMSGGLDGR